MRPLDPHEERLLRRLEEQILEEDPELAERLRTLCPPLLDRLAPTRWPPGAYITLSVVLLPTGLLLGDGSSVLGGVLAGVMAWVRHHGYPRRDR